MIIKITNNHTWYMEKDRYIAIQNGKTGQIQQIIQSIKQQLEIYSIPVLESPIYINSISKIEGYKKAVIIIKDFPNITLADFINLFSLVLKHSNLYIVSTLNSTEDFDSSELFKIIEV